MKNISLGLPQKPVIKDLSKKQFRGFKRLELRKLTFDIVSTINL